MVHLVTVVLLLSVILKDCVYMFLSCLC